MKKVLLMTMCLFVTIGFVSAQKFKPAPTFLKGNAEINVIFDYSNVVFDKDPQKKYYKSKSADWITEWEGNRRDYNANGFIKDVNKELESANVVIGNYPDAEYTMIVDVVNCDFGAYAGPFSVPAKLQCTIRIVKTGTTETLASVALKESQNPYTIAATPVDFDRIYLAFEEVGEKLGELLAKILKK